MASFADQQVEKLQTLLSANVGVKTITVGNTAVSYGDLLKQYDYWKGRQAREKTLPYLKPPSPSHWLTSR